MNSFAIQHNDLGVDKIVYNEYNNETLTVFCYTETKFPRSWLYIRMIERSWWYIRKIELYSDFTETFYCKNSVLD